MRAVGKGHGLLAADDEACLWIVGTEAFIGVEGLEDIGVVRKRKECA